MLAEAIEEEFDQGGPMLDPAATAKRASACDQDGLRAVRRGRPGLFRTAFTVPADLNNAGHPRALAGPSGRTWRSKAARRCFPR